MADTKPHTHAPTITSPYNNVPHDLGHGWWLNYGDTAVRICPLRGLFWIRALYPTDAQIAVALEKAVRKHDLGSKAAASRAAMLSRYVEGRADAWPSEEPA